jgi:hypothetical protein
MNRDRQKINERNEAIKNRYAYLYNVERLRHDDVIAKLEKEFWLAKRTLLNILFKK